VNTNTGNRVNTNTGTRNNERTVPTVYHGRAGEQAMARPGGGAEYRNANGQKVITNASGKVQRIEAPRGLAGTSKMVINHGPRGGRYVETGRPGARVVSYGPNRGFVERPLRPGYISRTYVSGGRSYARVYREYNYHGVAYYRYVPGIYYGPRFYGWAVTPWGMPVYYGWGGPMAAPWFGFYGGYFSPYPYYASPDMWLTDYLITENMRLAYENEQAANDQNPPPPAYGQQNSTPLSPEVKAAIANQVKQQLADEQAAGNSAGGNPPVPNNPEVPNPQPGPGGEQVPDALSPTERVFVVASNLDLTPSGGGQECSLSPGDVLMRLSDTPDANQNVMASVQSSKQGGCATGQTVAVSVQDLQEMHNHFREQLDSGLGQLAGGQVKGLPNGPANPQTVPEGTAAPAPDAAVQLVTQENEAATLESQVQPGGTSF
jgi:hypothetical protein